MAAKAIESAQINVNNNEVTVTLKLKEMTMYGQTASVDKMEYQLKDGTYQEATIIEEENGHPTKVQFKLDQNENLQMLNSITAEVIEVLLLDYL